MNMCGIFALLNASYENNSLESEKKMIEQFEKGKRRGPENSTLQSHYLQLTLGFHRLAINGLNEASNQPLVFENIVLICNGEIYNYKNLYQQMGSQHTTNSDCEERIKNENESIMVTNHFHKVLFGNYL